MESFFPKHQREGVLSAVSRTIGIVETWKGKKTSLKHVIKLRFYVFNMLNGVQLKHFIASV